MEKRGFQLTESLSNLFSGAEGCGFESRRAYCRKTNDLQAGTHFTRYRHHDERPRFSEIHTEKPSVFRWETIRMGRPKAKAPSLRYHLSGQSVVTIDGRDFYLGKHDSPKSIARYAVLISIYQQNGLRLPDGITLEQLDGRVGVLTGAIQPTNQADEPLTVRHITASYREHAKTKYANSPQELHRVSQLCDELDEHDGDLLADKFGPLALQRHRQRWVKRGYRRAYCNRLTKIVRRMFKYAVSQELCENATWQRLTSVEPLREGETEAPESEPVRPVSIDVVRATAAHLSPVLKSMVRIQTATGMRPSELCNLRPCDVDRSGDVWFYRPPKHKTAKKGKRRAIPIIGDAREALVDYLNRDAQAYCFSPAESVAWWQAKKRAARKTKVPPSQASRAKASPRKQPGEKYTATSYRQSIQRNLRRQSSKHNNLLKVWDINK